MNNLEDFPVLSGIAWDFEKDPHLFPLHLFQHFQKKYCRASDTLGIRMDFFNFDCALCKCTINPLVPKTYSMWLQIRRVWETAMSFGITIGKDEDFNPFLRQDSEQLMVGLYAHVFDGNSEIEIKPFSLIRNNSSSAVLLAQNTLMNEILEEFSKTSLKFTA